MLRTGVAHQLDALIRREDGLLREVPPYADDDAIEEARRPLHDVDVAVRRGIEGTGVDGDAITHAVAIPPLPVAGLASRSGAPAPVPATLFGRGVSRVLRHARRTRRVSRTL